MSLLYSQANTTRDELALLETPAPMGPRHQPFPFAEYVDSVERALNTVGFAVTAEEYEITHEGNRLFGAMEIVPEQVHRGEVLSEDEYRLLVGLRGAHDQSLQRELVLGNRIIVCSNLMFSGNIARFNTKQTLNIRKRLPRLIDAAIGHIPQLAQDQANKLEAYKAFDFRNHKIGDAALVEIFRRGGLTAAQLGRATSEWLEPSFEEHARFGWSAWRLINAVTEAQKPTGNTVNHSTIADRTRIADQWLANVVGVESLVH